MRRKELHTSHSPQICIQRCRVCALWMSLAAAHSMWAVLAARTNSAGSCKSQPVAKREQSSLRQPAMPPVSDARRASSANWRSWQVWWHTSTHTVSSACTPSRAGDLSVIAVTQPLRQM
ncbi:hypothetical protein JYU34_020703 [Plutella xylostella]|uniref:Secreted protein n=1 Tax=Plutella xylostella TaxID=51655 RepID=A0ABQ7PUV8_PLUXY|nr:hypothetical protein JYU34_020703 [Plutella xylostella]